MMLTPIVRTSPFAVLVFRGTEQTIKDFIADLDLGVLPLQQNKIAVHDGFAAALDSVWDEIEGALGHLTCPVFYTGHSLGAALATLAAARREPKAVYTFGSPRVGNQAFVSSLAHIPICRVIDDEDAVTRVPPEIMGFRHVGTEQYLLEISAKSLFAWLKHFGAPPKPLADHAPINYVDRIMR